MKLSRLTEIMRISGVPVYVHWSVILLATLVLFGAIERPAVTLAAWTAYFSLILIHECGHMIMARRKRCDVFAIELYPILGLVRFSEPWSRYDDALIAWGGIAAQAVVAVPLIVWISIFGFTRYDAVNVVIGILVYYSSFLAVFNLIPAPPFDGAKAWPLIPALIKRAKNRHSKPKRVVGWRGW